MLSRNKCNSFRSNPLQNNEGWSRGVHYSRTTCYFAILNFDHPSIAPLASHQTWFEFFLLNRLCHFHKKLSHLTQRQVDLLALQSCSGERWSGYWFGVMASRGPVYDGGYLSEHLLLADLILQVLRFTLVRVWAHVVVFDCTVGESHCHTYTCARAFVCISRNYSIFTHEFLSQDRPNNRYLRWGYYDTTVDHIYKYRTITFALNIVIVNTKSIFAVHYFNCG